MGILILFVVSLTLFAVIVSAGWQFLCWAFRKMLGIPKYPPYPEPEIEPLPWYLDDRIDPPKR